MEQRHLENARVFKAFCDETRLSVLSFCKAGKSAPGAFEKVSVGSRPFPPLKILIESGCRFGAQGRKMGPIIKSAGEGANTPFPADQGQPWWKYRDCGRRKCCDMTRAAAGGLAAARGKGKMWMRGGRAPNWPRARYSHQARLPRMPGAWRRGGGSRPVSAYT
jgi:hypothetical protein